MEGFAIWLTGIPASGKSTIARKLSKRLRKEGLRVQILESDELRRVLTPNPRYTEDERNFFYGVMVYIGSILAGNGVNVIFDATAHKRMYREKAREMIKKFLEVYVECPVEVCRRRDRKNLYKLAELGKITTLPGLQVPYEEPLNPDVKVNTALETVDECVEKIIRKLIEKGFLK